MARVETAELGEDARPALGRRGRGGRVVRRVLLLACAVLMLDALVGDRGLMTTLRARRDFQHRATELQRLRDENARLRDHARRLREDPRAIEAVARRELGLIRPGEILVTIRDR